MRYLILSEIPRPALSGTRDYCLFPPFIRRDVAIQLKAGCASRLDRQRRGILADKQ